MVRLKKKRINNGLHRLFRFSSCGDVTTGVICIDQPLLRKNTPLLQQGKALASLAFKGAATETACRAHLRDFLDSWCSGPQMGLRKHWMRCCWSSKTNEVQYYSIFKPNPSQWSPLEAFSYCVRSVSDDAQAVQQLSGRMKQRHLGLLESYTLTLAFQI